MDLSKQKLPKTNGTRVKNWANLSASFLLFLLLSSTGCGHKGPKVDVCIVDAPNDVFRCTPYKGKKYSVGLPQGFELLCASPEDTEAFLKECQQGNVLEVTLCSYRREGSDFRCSKALETDHFISVPAADNYVCISPLHRKRIIERCQGGTQNKLTDF